MNLQFNHLALLALAFAPAAINACQDDDHWAYGRGRKTGDCASLAARGGRGCGINGYDGRSGREACPIACGTCPDDDDDYFDDDDDDGGNNNPGQCQDDSSWGIVRRRGRRVVDCDWVASKSNPTKVCNTMRGDDGRLARDACYEACSSCPPGGDDDSPSNPGPTPTRHPTPSPTPYPTPYPTPAPTPPRRTGGSSDFDIDMDLTNVSRGNLYTSAKNMWESVITGDVPDNSYLAGQTHLTPGCGRYPANIDDLHICAIEESIDGPGHVLGSAGAQWVRTGSGIPLAGIMRFDSADVGRYSDAAWESVIKHEMGHIIGISSQWSDSRYTTNVVTNGVYRGAKALSVWQDDWQCVGTPPIETDGGDGTAGGHWDEQCLDNELMTGYLNTFGANPLSKLSIAALDDMGYQVDMSQADPYTPPASCCRYGARRALANNLRGLNAEKPHGLSDESHAMAVEYGLSELNKLKATAPKERVQDDLVYIGDMFTSVIVEQDGELYEVGVYA